MILAHSSISQVFVRQGRCVLMPRYLGPLAPPPTILNKQEPGQQQAEAVAWSVFKNPGWKLKIYLSGLSPSYRTRPPMPTSPDWEMFGRRASSSYG